MPVCDICTRDLTTTKFARIPSKRMKEAVVRGFNPFRAGLVGPHTITGSAVSAFGLSGEKAYQDWRQMVMKDETDWALCPTCAQGFENAAASQKSPASEKREGHKSKWRFWK
jgi:hypothetical protein